MCLFFICIYVNRKACEWRACVTAAQGPSVFSHVTCPGLSTRSPTALGSLEAKPHTNGELMKQQVPATEGYGMTPSERCPGDHLRQIERCCCCYLRLFATLWTVACQAPLSMGFSRQEYWSGWPCSPPGDLPDPGIKVKSPMSPALAGGFFTTSTTWNE